MSEMKLIMERWDKYLVEQSFSASCRATFPNAGSFAAAYEVAFSIATGDKNAKKRLDRLQVGSEWAANMGAALVAAGIVTGGATAVVGSGVLAFAGLGNMIISAIRSGRNKKFDKRILDTIFAALCIDPSVLEITDDELEEEILNNSAPFNDMQNYLNSLDFDDPVPDINALFVAEINKVLKKQDQSELADKT